MKKTSPREQMLTNKKRKRVVQEYKVNEIIRYDDDQETFTLRELYLIQQLLLPREMKKIDDIEWNHHHIKLVIEKKLYRDVRNRGFVIPEYQILEDARDFLKPHEVQDLKKNIRKITLKLFDQNLKEYELNLMWQQTDSYYNLTDGWGKVVRHNNLKVDEKVQLWSFRSDDDELGFALFKLPQ
ncbi:hypothetical protein QN277_028824 [Acacia crassicarpa]|uniref:TF-B3 domain-containing protein n=1 Tax=Acacia crassicarpa TaxID=499986 RepID=A0AAE1J894_9FABA|nr:hypothetical protein QN277_028824 [Acacia crassicarpa]